MKAVMHRKLFLKAKWAKFIYGKILQINQISIKVTNNT